MLRGFLLFLVSRNEEGQRERKTEHSQSLEEPQTDDHGEQSCQRMETEAGPDEFRFDDVADDGDDDVQDQQFHAHQDVSGKDAAEAHGSRTVPTPRTGRISSRAITKAQIQLLLIPMSVRPMTSSTKVMPMIDA